MERVACIFSVLTFLRVFVFADFALNMIGGGGWVIPSKAVFSNLIFLQPGQSRQPCRAKHPGLCRRHPIGGWRPLPRGPPGPCGGRPSAEEAGHRPGQEGLRVGAQDRTAGRTQVHHRVLPEGGQPQLRRGRRRMEEEPRGKDRQVDAEAGARRAVMDSAAVFDYLNSIIQAKEMPYTR